ncbi:hypothetical protein JXB28_03450 [Candidatus Woesearchaeota archaeon]|nr:hypothetical protein [Candidatus Woesearchaeota archaeon]
MIKEIDPSKLEYSKKFQNLCLHPFYGHPNGCPNYGKKQGCPPDAPLIDEILDLNKGVFLIFTEFNVGQFSERIRKSHPKWQSPRQWYNPRYWQPKARKIHREEERLALSEKSLELIVSNPEASGINISKLMADNGFHLRWDWPPAHILVNDEFLKNSVYLVSVGGFIR